MNEGKLYFDDIFYFNTEIKLEKDTIFLFYFLFVNIIISISTTKYHGKLNF